MKRTIKKGDSVSVLGLGRSGMAVVEYFVKKGAVVYAYDDAPRDSLGERAVRLRSLGVPLLSGAEEIRGDLVFRSPVIRPDTPRLCRARLRGARVIGEAEYFASLCPAPVFAVTGSDGKTTTASYLAALLESRGVPFEPVCARAGKLYPEDIALNLFTLGGFLFANTKHASADVLEFASANGVLPAHVKQGYAKCSSMTLGGAVVTADNGIYFAARARGLDALLIAPGGIGIEKYGTGFIGGASGALEKGKTAVFGNILSHPDGESILAFARAHGEEIISLGKGELFDYGGIVRIDT